jgi:hypothetical protein
LIDGNPYSRRLIDLVWLNLKIFENLIGKFVVVPCQLARHNQPQPKESLKADSLRTGYLLFHLYKRSDLCTSLPFLPVHSLLLGLKQLDLGVTEGGFQVLDARRLLSCEVDEK